MGRLYIESLFYDSFPFEVTKYSKKEKFNQISFDNEQYMEFMMLGGYHEYESPKEEWTEWWFTLNETKLIICILTKNGSDFGKTVEEFAKDSKTNKKIVENMVNLWTYLETKRKFDHQKLFEEEFEIYYREDDTADIFNNLNPHPLFPEVELNLFESLNIVGDY